MHDRNKTTWQRFRVGGAVRDRLLRAMGYSVPEGDVDWVVVGATPEVMIQQGFLPVGADFPVFLHPITHEEHALARTERKTARGYHGFQFYAAPDVTLEEDLRRRDLTINAMAEKSDGTLIDPYGGQNDLRHHRLRHVSNAFGEDPVRILRTARFSAKLADFTIAPETLALMQRMVAEGEADALVAERVWGEFQKGLMEPHPEKMVQTLITCGLWSRLFSDVVWNPQKQSALMRAAQLQTPLSVRTTILFVNDTDTELLLKNRLTHWRLPSHIMALALLLVRSARSLVTAQTPEDMADVLEKSDVMRRPERFHEALTVMTCQIPDFDAARWETASQKWASVDAGSIARQAVCEGRSQEIAERVKRARLLALQASE